MLKRPAVILLTIICLSLHAAALEGFGAPQRPAEPTPQERKLDGKIEPRRPGKTENELVAEAFAASIREALRKPSEGETRVRGLFTRVDCNAKGVVFIVKAGKRQLRLRRPGFDGLHIIAFTPDAAGTELTCGPRQPEGHVVATYRPAAAAAAAPRVKTDGELTALEFVPADFQLEAVKAVTRRARN
ncbi:MAG: hypothetical protein LC802_04325 [Acidobacteria bacterium]|nr:hypothetical protein [Acidobacteriota bacterium]